MPLLKVVAFCCDDTLALSSMICSIFFLLISSSFSNFFSTIPLIFFSIFFLVITLSLGVILYILYNLVDKVNLEILETLNPLLFCHKIYFLRGIEYISDEFSNSGPETATKFSFGLLFSSKSCKVINVLLWREYTPSNIIKSLFELLNNGINFNVNNL